MVVLVAQIKFSAALHTAEGNEKKKSKNTTLVLFSI